MTLTGKVDAENGGCKFENSKKTFLSALTRDLQRIIVYWYLQVQK